MLCTPPVLPLRLEPSTLAAPSLNPQQLGRGPNGQIWRRMQVFIKFGTVRVWVGYHQVDNSEQSILFAPLTDDIIGPGHSDLILVPDCWAITIENKSPIDTQCMLLFSEF